MSVKSYPYHASVQDVDLSRRIRLSRFVNYLLDAADKNAFENKFGIQQLQAQNHSWVLSRLAVEMDTFPAQDDDFWIDTWIFDVGRICTTRCFSIRNSDGNVLGAASSVWAMIDMESRKAVNLQEAYGRFVTNVAPLCARPEKIPNLRTESFATYEVKYSDIDVNNHTNSVKYIEWLLDLIPNPGHFFSSKRISRFEMNYVNEALLGEKLSLYKEDVSESDMLFEIKRGQDVICKMQIVFE